jgi:hypothetical protein
MSDQRSDEGRELERVTFVKRVTVGNLNRPTTEEEMEQQTRLLNKCLQEFPRGWIISRTISTLVFGKEDARLTYQQTTYHIGWKRKPFWLEVEEEKQPLNAGTEDTTINTS